MPTIMNLFPSCKEAGRKAPGISDTDTDRKSLLALRGVGRESEAESVRFHGRYEFQKPLDPLDVDAIIREMTGFRPDHHMAQAA